MIIDKLNYENEILLVTGGTGSFGSAFVEFALDNDLFKEIRIFSRDEKKQHDMRIRFKSDRLRFYIGDIRDYNSIEFATKGVDFIFCAAALKQVPSCEFFPLEAVKTNVIGTDNTIRAAILNGVRKVVVLSTDKAVYPVNAMGMSKALMEKTALSYTKGNDHSTSISVTRYGNVMASRGSVIPHFIDQILSGDAITITDPNMTRFIMSLKESVYLVMHAFEHDMNGSIYVQKSPSTTIGQLARVLKVIFNSRSELKIIGTRHGEKRYESLVSKEEIVRAKDQGNYYCIVPDDRDLNYEKYFESGAETLTKGEDYNSDNTQLLTDEELLEILLNLDYVKNALENVMK
jgi:UDP-N-acetylglucosamine 4,6-dehydratase